MKCAMELLIHSQTQTVQLLTFGNGYVISFRFTVCVITYPYCSSWTMLVKSVPGVPPAYTSPVLWLISHNNSQIWILVFYNRSRKLIPCYKMAEPFPHRTIKVWQLSTLHLPDPKTRVTNGIICMSSASITNATSWYANVILHVSY